MSLIDVNNDKNSQENAIASVDDIVIDENVSNNSLNLDNNIKNKSEKAVQRSYQIWNVWNWIQSNAIDSVEARIFECLKTKIDRRFVYINNRTQRIWTASANTDSTNTPILLIHGYCGAIGLWVHNWDSLCENHPLYAIDVLGFGRSSRPKFSSDPIEAENEFVKSIEDWRQAVGLDRMILLGHSFGGFLSTAYALKYPQYVKSLILVDTWGFSEPNINAQIPFIFRAIIKIAQYISPFSLIRLTGSFGMNVFKRVRPDFRRKFANIFGETDLIYDYIYHANKQSPSGEIAFNTIADQIRHAKYPMVQRIETLNGDIPIWFVYGNDTRMDKSAGYKVKEIRRDFAVVSVTIIKDAGHHVYADQPDLFNETSKQILQSIDGTHTYNTDTNLNEYE